MKKKVFSLMMLFLAVFGFARANELTVYEGTTQNNVVPAYVFYFDDFTRSQYVIPADDLSAMYGGDIQSITWYTTSGNIPYTSVSTVDVYVTEVASASISAFVATADCQVVYHGTLDFVTEGAGGKCVINFSTPYHYNGGNLLIGCENIDDLGYKNIYFLGQSVSGASIGGSNSSSLSGVTPTQRNFIPETTFTYTGGGAPLDALHVKYMDGDVEVIDALNMGTRPVGAWMEPFNFTMYTTGRTYTVNVIDFTPSDGLFTVTGEELPFQVIRDNDVDLTMVCNGTEAGIIERQFVAITEGDRAAHIWPVTVDLYDPQTPDVWEKACTQATTFPFVEVPATAHNIALHNDYTLPFPEIPEGYDAVYKLVFTADQMLDAEVTYGDNGKVALYREGFEGEGGPMATNYYTGIEMGSGGVAGGTFEAQIGEGTSTFGYFPFYTLYNYSIAENLFLAPELEEAGVTTAPMSSLSWYATNEYGYNQQGITIWMANVDDEALTTTSHSVTGMTKVYTGAMTPVIGWNEFVFNEGSFAWDGHSNILIYCQRNNGEWNSTVYWEATPSLPFNASSYQYQDSGAYDPTIANSMYTSTTRPNIIMKSEGRNRDEVLFSDTFESGSLNNWTLVDADADGDGWQIATPAAYGIGDAHSGTYCASSWSWNSYTLYPDNYMISPLVDGATSISYYVATNTVYPDHYAVMASSTGTNISNFVTVYEEDAYRGSNSNGVRSSMAQGSNREMSTWAAKSVTLPAGTKYVAFRHYNSDDMNYLFIDDVTVYGNGGVTPPTPPTPPTPGYEYTAGPVIEDLPVTAGTYYLVASSTTPDFEVTINAEAMPCPLVDGFAFNPMPADNADGIEPASVTLTWSIPPYATGWRLIFGTTYHPEPNHPQTIMYPEDGSFTTSLANSYTVRNLWNNNNYFWRVEFNNGSCEDGVSSPVWGFTTHLNVPQNLTAEDETVFNDENVVLNWNAVVDRTYRTYNVYRDGELIGSTQMNNIENTTYTDGPLAYNMNGYTYYVTAVYDEGESAPSNTVNVKVSGRGNVDGHVYEQDGATGVAGATVTMTGLDEFGVSHTYNFQTNAQGAYSGAVYAGAYNGQAAKEGYQTITEPVQGNPIDVTYNVTTSPVDYILDENFDPVCTVIAQYYPDSLDPQSPYVKVYWGCGLPGEEIIEPFETGDFSLFDWQVESTYPWVITTENPYEGQYCMKSGNQQVLSSTSTMQVTVNIPADGEMSFFGKISSEQGWDYGYFYIDNQQMGAYTGIGNWAERKFPITAGDHTFKWEYTEDFIISDGDDCFYVDYITFYRRPEPLGAGWHTYLEGEFNDALRSNLTDNPSFGYHYPTSITSQYNGFQLTKVSMFSDDLYGAVGGNYTVNIYQGGSVPGEGTLVSSQTVELPVGLGQWVDWDLNTPVSVNGNQDLWVIYYVNQAGGMGYPAGMCNSDSNPNGDWWNGGEGWENYGGGVWTMRNYFTDRSGRSVVLGTAKDAHNTSLAMGQGAPISSKLRQYVKGDNTVTAVSLNPGAPSKPLVMAESNRALSHYRIYRTNCYNDGPYTEDNTVLLATNWPGDTIYIDVEWSDLPAGVYKWGVGVVYAGNRGELIESPISWAAPVVVDNRSFTSNEAAQIGPRVIKEVAEMPQDRNRDYLQYCSETYDGGIGTGGGAVYWGVRFPAANLAAYAGQNLTKVGVFINTDGDYGWTYSGNYTANVYLGGTTAPGTLVSTASEYLTGDFSWHDVTLTTPVAIDGTQDLWLTFYTADIAYPMSGCTYVGNPDSDFLSLDGDTWEHSTDYGLDYTWMIRGTVENGDTPPVPPTPPTPGDNLNQLAMPRESETIWSNCLDKDMWLGENAVDITVLLNSADSPEGVTVSFVNLNEAEQEMYPVADVVLDGTGYYAWDTFRKGDYQVSVTLDGYEPIVENVSIWNPTSLRYVMIEIIYGVNNLYVSRTGWAMWEGQGSVTPGPTPPTPGDGDSFEFGFEDGFEGWTTIDNDGNGLNWVNSINSISASGYDYTGLAHGGNYFVYSQSFIDYDGAYEADNYLVTPQKYAITSGSTLTFWADNANDSYPDHFAVAVATADNPTASDFVDVWSHSGAKAEGKAATRHGENRYENWRSHSVDLSDYAGQNVWIAFHHQDYDMYEIWIDDVTLTAGAKNGGDRHLEYYKVLCTSIDGVPIYNNNTVYPFCQLATENLVEGEQYICKVAAVYSTGMSAYEECVWQYESCENYAGTLNGVTVNGNTISWDYPTGTGPVPPPQPGENAVVVLNVPTDIWGDGSGYQMLLDADATMYTQLAAAIYFDEIGSFDDFEYTIPENADYGINPANIVVNNSVAIEIPAGTYDYAIINPDKVSTIWFAGNSGNAESKGDDMVYEAGKMYTYTLSSSGTGDMINLTITDRNGMVSVPTGENVATPARAIRTAENLANRDGEWYYYDNGVNVDGIGTGGGQFYWAVMFPASSYNGNALTKVSAYDYMAMTGNVTIYNDGATAPANQVGQMDVTFTGAEDFVEFTFAEPVTIDPTKNVWVVFYNQSGANYPAACCDNTGDANGRWVSMDGVDWMDILEAAPTLNYTWMIRAYIEEGSTPPPVPGDGNVLGAMVFLNGEWEAFVPYPTNEYTFEEGGQYCVRMVYDGTAELPSNNFFYAMSCEECVGDTPGTCEPGAPIHAEQVDGDHIKIWWGEQPAEPISEWLYYFDQTATEISPIGTGSATDVYWGIMIPADMLTSYVGTSLTKVAMYQIADYNSNPVTVNIFLGGSNAPQTLVSTMNYTPSVFDDFQEVTLTTAVPVDGTQNLWITVKQNGDYPALGLATTGNPNARWISLDGSSWEDVASYDLNYDWMIMGFVSNQGKGGELTPIEFTPGVAPADFTLSQAETVSKTVDMDFMNRSSIVKYNVYRSTEANGTYTMIGEVAETGATYYEYIDEPGTAGTFFYQVRAQYDDDCESEPAMAADDPSHNYVSGTTDGLAENDTKVALYPNPTNGNVTIEAAGMSRITVVSILGQVVYDTELNADEFTLNMGQFNAGLYMVRVYTENGVTVKRVTVMQ